VSLLVKVYGKKNCHLCDIMLSELERLRENSVFDIEYTDIDSDPELQRQYATLIPVLFVDDKEICRYHLDRQLLMNFLR